MTCRTPSLPILVGLTTSIFLVGLPGVSEADSSKQSTTADRATIQPKAAAKAKTVTKPGNAASKASDEPETEATATDDVYPLPDIYEPPVVTIDSLRPALVERVQRALKRRGYALGRADGIVGPMTRLALNDFLAALDWPTGHQLNDVVLRALGIAPDHLHD